MLTAKLFLGTVVAGVLAMNCPTAECTTAQNTERDTVEGSHLDLSGVMTINGEKVANYTVYIFKDGAPSDTFQVTNRLEQHYLLPLHHNYALKFSKPGYKDRILLVNTHIQQQRVQPLYTFRYDISFISNHESNTFDDFPVAFVDYDAKKKDFDYNRAYHSNVRTDNKPAATTTASKSWH